MPERAHTSLSCARFLPGLFTAASLAASAAQAQAPTISVVYPRLNEPLWTARPPAFVMGKVTPVGTVLLVNGLKADVDIDGAFIGVAPVLELPAPRPAEYKGKTYPANGFFVLEARKGSTVKVDTLFVQIAPQLTVGPVDHLGVDGSYDGKPGNAVLYAGKDFDVEVKATPACRASVWIPGLLKETDAPESFTVKSFYWGEGVFGPGPRSTGDTVRGIYRTTLHASSPLLAPAPLLVRLVHPKLGEIIDTLAARVMVLPDSVCRVVEFIDSMTITRNEPGGGYEFFIPRSVRARFGGSLGGWTRLDLSPTFCTWVPSSSVKVLPAGTPSPTASVKLVRTFDHADRTDIVVPMQLHVAYTVTQTLDPQAVHLRIFNTTASIDWIRYGPARGLSFSSLVDRITWEQSSEGITDIHIYLKTPQQWGYRVSYDGTNLLLSLRKPPVLSRKGRRPLSGLTVGLDPGHNPEPGAIGPRGTMEKDVNLAISRLVERELRGLGAKVVYLHTTDPLPLGRRAGVADRLNPNILVSIHNNAVPEGVDPLANNGTSTFYYHPQSLRLAENIQASVLKALRLPNFGLYWDNLYMCRIHQMPSVLVEPAFLMLPEQERLLTDPRAQLRIARAIAGGIAAFARESMRGSR